MREFDRHEQTEKTTTNHIGSKVEIRRRLNGKQSILPKWKAGFFHEFVDMGWGEWCLPCSIIDSAGTIPFLAWPKDTKAVTGSTVAKPECSRLDKSDEVTPCSHVVPQHLHSHHQYGI